MSTPDKEPIPEGQTPEQAAHYYVKYGEKIKTLTAAKYAAFKEGISWAYRHLSSQPSQGLREAGIEAHKLIKSGYWHNAADVLFTALNPNPFASSVQPIEGEQKDFPGLSDEEFKKASAAAYFSVQFVTDEKTTDAFIEGWRQGKEREQPEAQPIADHIHVQLKSGSVATVSPDASTEILGALNTMAEKAMQMPIADKGVGPLEIQEGEFDEQAIKIASRVASAFNEELEKMYADLRKQLEEAKNLIEGFVRIWRAEGNKGGAPKNITTAIRFLAQFPETPEIEK